MERLNGIEIVDVIICGDGHSEEEFSKACEQAYAAFDTINGIVRVLDSKRYSDKAKLIYIKEVIEYYWGNTNKPKIGQRVVISGTEYDIVAVSPEPYIEFDDGSKHYAMTVQKVGGDQNDVLYINDAQVDKE